MRHLGSISSQTNTGDSETLLYTVFGVRVWVKNSAEAMREVSCVSACRLENLTRVECKGSAWLGWGTYKWSVGECQTEPESRIFFPFICLLVFFLISKSFHGSCWAGREYILPSARSFKVCVRVWRK